MGFLQRLSSVSSSTRMRASYASDLAAHSQAFFSGEDIGPWTSTLSAAGVNVTPELAMCLSAYYCGVTTIAYDLATLPCQVYKNRPDGGKDRVQGGIYSHAAGIGSLVYRLRWQPNNVQSATEFFVSQVAQFLLRDVAYAEIKDGPTGFLEQLLPRHPDRVFPERLPSGAIRYKLIEANGQPRYLTDQEMHVVRGMSLSGLTSVSRVQYGAGAIGTALAAQRAAGKFFKSGMTAAIMASYAGDSMEDEDEAALHRSISRYAAGVENTFGLLLVPDDVKVSNLSPDPDKAQMMLAQEWGVFEVARHLRIPPHKLMVKMPQNYASQYQSAVDYAVGCVRPTAVTFEQSMQRDLILAKDTYGVKFHLPELLQGDPEQMGDLIEKLIASRAITPSEARMEYLDKNPDPHLDELSERDNQPGAAKTTAPQAPGKSNQSALAWVKGYRAVCDNAERCVRRERAAVEKLAKKHASDPEGWKTGLRAFYGEHATFLAQTMRMPLDIARGYAAQHGSAFEAQGVVIIDGDAGTAWETCEADELAALALEEDRAA